MADSNERSPNGSPIYRHEDREREFELAIGNADSCEELSAHMERHRGKPATVFHEIISDLVHVDVHHIEPTPEKPFHTLFTTGMSDRPMTVPPEAAGYEYAELMVSLPASWKVTQEDWEDESWYWPVKWLKQLARLPHEYETWLGAGHSVPNGDPARPFASGTKLCSWMLLPSVIAGPDSWAATLKDGRTVRFYALHALHLEELTLKLTKGAEALMGPFDQHGVSEVLDPARPSVVRRKLFGLF